MKAKRCPETAPNKKGFHERFASEILKIALSVHREALGDSAEAVNADRNKFLKNIELQTFRGVAELMLGSIDNTHTGLKSSHF